MGVVVQLFKAGTLRHNGTAGERNTHELTKSILYSQMQVQDEFTLWAGAMFLDSGLCY